VYIFKFTVYSLINLRLLFDKFSILPGISLDNAAKVSWIILYGTKYCLNGIIAVGVTRERTLPLFGTIEEIWVVYDFVYFQVSLYQTVCLEYCYQAYNVEQLQEKEIFICAYERLVDYNVFHIKSINGELYIPVKYDIDDIIEEYLADNFLLTM